MIRLFRFEGSFSVRVKADNNRIQCARKTAAKEMAQANDPGANRCKNTASRNCLFKRQYNTGKKLHPSEIWLGLWKQGKRQLMGQEKLLDGSRSRNSQLSPENFPMRVMSFIHLPYCSTLICVETVLVV